VFNGHKSAAHTNSSDGGTGKACLGGGMHCPSASSFMCDKSFHVVLSPPLAPDTGDATVAGDHNHKCSAVAEMGDRLATTHGPKIERGLCHFWRGEAGSQSNTMSPGRQCVRLGVRVI